MSRTPPTNSICSMSLLRAGTSRFRASPAKNAPTIPSIPARSATSAAAVSATTTKRKRAPRCWPTPANTQRVDPRKDERAEQREDHEPDDHLEEDADRTRVARHRACDDGQHGEGERVRHHRPSAGDPTARSLSSPCSCTIGYATRVCDAQSEPEEHRRGEAVAEGQHEQDAEHEREGERERAERQRAAPIGRELVEVELEAGEEHQEEDPEVAERLDDALALDPAEDERADEQSAEEDADDSGEAEALEDQRADEDNGGRDEERPLGRRRRKLEREQHGVSVQRAPDGDSAPLGRALRGCQIRELRVPTEPRELDRCPSGRCGASRGSPRRSPAGRTPRPCSTRRDR